MAEPLKSIKPGSPLHSSIKELLEFHRDPAAGQRKMLMDCSAIFFSTASFRQENNAAIDAVPTTGIKHLLSQEFGDRSPRRAARGTQDWGVEYSVNAVVFQTVGTPVLVVALICQEFLGFAQAIEQMPGNLIVAGLARARKNSKGRPSPSVTACSLEFRRSSDTAGKNSFFSRPAAVRWALRWVASIISLSG